MRTVTRTEYVATLGDINERFDSVKFEALIADVFPGGISHHDDGRVASASWYHHHGTDYHCTTIFSSYRVPSWSKLTPGCYIQPKRQRGTLIVVGTYKGEPGEWHLSKRGSPPKAPYEI